MKILKLLITGLVLTTTIVAAGLVHAQASVTVSFDVESVTSITTCGSITFSSTFGHDEGQISPSCNIVAYSNDPDGFTISMKGTPSGWYNDVTSHIWTKLPTNQDTINTSTCSSGCEEAWGWRVVNGTASEYDTVNNDGDNKENPFDANSVWHTVNTTEEVFITNTGPTADKTANFDIELGASTHNTDAGNYGNETLTITITPS